MQQTICAKVNVRLLSKADRLFTGSVSGRIIEILQNARRAGASQVEIINSDDLITVKDNGIGIEDFGKLLDLGGSGWDEQMEAGYHEVNLDASELASGVYLYQIQAGDPSTGSGQSSILVKKMILIK